jgi:hypothetical protein
MTRRIALATLFVAALATVAARGQEVDVTGTWAMSLETPQGTSTPTLTLKQAGDKLTGTYAGRMGEAPLAGSVKGKDVTFSVKVNAQGQEFELVFSGAADGDQMKGTVDFGGMGSANWSAARKK